MIRRIGLFLVMSGALALSFAGQKHAVAPLLGGYLAIVFALTNDLAALLALHEVMTARSARARRWAWSVLLLAGGSGLGLNTWDALRGGTLPGPAAVAVGAGPVVLAWLLSHLVALVLTEQRQEQENASQADRSTAKEPVSEPASQPLCAESGQSQTTEPESASAPAQHAHGETSGQLAGVDEPTLPATLPALSAAPHEALPETTVDSRSESPVDSLPIDLIDRAEKAERQHLKQTKGKRGLPYREAPRRLNVRYETARAALDAARERMRNRGAIAA